MNKINRRWFSSSTVEDIISVSCLDPLGPIAWRNLFHNFSSLQTVLKAETNKLAQIGLAPAQINALFNRPQSVQAAAKLMGLKKIQLITIDDSGYPYALKEIPDPPLWIFYRGDLSVLKHTCLTVVGTRKPSGYALTAIKHILPNDLVSELTIISGLAYGIDKAAHELSLAHGGKTVAVLAGGLDTTYPAEHYRLAERIIESGGLLMSEYPPLSRPRPWRFPVRNRILAGLSMVTLIVEAAKKSGSLTTAKSALDYNRDVLAVPNEITRHLADGGNFLIKHGARLVDCAADVADALQVKLKRSQPSDKKEVALLELIAKTPLTVDTLVELTKQPIEEILGTLTQLELSGSVYQPQPGFYEAKK